MMPYEKQMLPLGRVTVPAISALIVMGLAAAMPAAAGNWPGWRGDGSGISSEKGLPTYWNGKTNVVWKTALPGEGNSSPVVWGDRVFLTASTEKGMKRHVICLSAANGEMLWQNQLTADRESKTDPKNGYASSTPVADGRNVYAFFNSPGLVALDTKGELRWTRDLGPFNNVWNMAASPVLCDDMVIMACDHDADSFIAAINCSDGQVRWKAPRNAPRQYATPLVITVGGKKQIVVNGAPVVAYSPEDGKEIWTCSGMKNMLTPSAVFHDGLVYVTSGRNGPSMAIDPSGRGDVSETHVAMHFPIGGPYVPSPLVYPSLFLPGDNGAIRFINLRGKETVKHRLRAHFTSSPVVGDGKIYWTDEKGDTYVIVSLADAHTPQDDLVQIKVTARNSLGEKVLASPAIANGRIYIRTDRHLFCIGGAEKTTPPGRAPEELRSFAQLKKLYDEHQAPQGDDVSLRLEIVESLSKLKDPAAIPFLKRIAEKDNHWDVSEEAAKVMGVYDDAAVPTLIEMLGSRDWRPYLKVIPAGHLGRLKAAEAVPALVKLAANNDALVRIAALEALAAIAGKHDAEAPAAVRALTAALGDREGAVRRTGIGGLGLLAGKLAGERGAVINTVLDLAADKSPIVAERAREALLGPFNVDKEVVMKDELLYGEQRKEPVIAHLSAGPIRMKFQDGELRYLRVGDKEIARRIYFAVRDKRWDTVMPQFSKIDVKQQENAFEITMRAACTNDVADYRWSGKIAGRQDGKITFTVTGRANADFTSLRVGLCVLYGAESLAGQKFEALNEKDEVTAGVFAEPVSQQHLASNFRTLRYTTPAGMQVIIGLDGRFDMEDQRNFGDSSYKAFSGMPYRYPNVSEGEKHAQTLTLEVKNAKPGPERDAPIAITVGKPIPGAKIPKLLPAEESSKGAGFMEYNNNRGKYADAELVTMPYNPAAHMPDGDTFMENIPAIVDQVKTIRSFAPKAKFRIGPITIDSPSPRPGPDPRNEGLFATAWCAGMIKYLASAGVDEAVFGLGTGAGDILEITSHVAGREVLATSTAPHDPVDALAIDDGGRIVIWLINTTNRHQTVTVPKFSESAKLDILRLDGSEPRQEPVENRVLEIGMEPFEVYLIAERR